MQRSKGCNGRASTCPHAHLQLALASRGCRRRRLQLRLVALRHLSQLLCQLAPLVQLSQPALQLADARLRRRQLRRLRLLRLRRLLRRLGLLRELVPHAGVQVALLRQLGLQWAGWEGRVGERHKTGQHQKEGHSQPGAAAGQQHSPATQPPL